MRYLLSILVIPFILLAHPDKSSPGNAKLFSKKMNIEAELDSLVSQVSYDSLYKLLRYLEDQGIHNSGDGNATLNIVRDHIVEKLRSYGYTVTLQEVMYSGDQGDNIIIEKPGDGTTDKKIVVGAHYDSVPYGPGINDNGSGVAALLEIARLLAKRDLHYPLIMVWFTGEEHGYYGSRVYVDSLYNSGTDLLLMFNMDQIGGLSNLGGEPYTTTKITCERDERSTGGTDNNVLSYAYTDTLAMMTRTYSTIGTVIDYAYGTDYIPFEEKGYVITGYYEYVPEGNPNYHNAGDTLGNMDVGYLEQVTRGAVAFTAYLAGNPRPAGYRLLLFHNTPNAIDLQELPIDIQLAVVSDTTITSGNFYYRLDNGATNEQMMTPVDMDGDTVFYNATIESLAEGDSLNYYFLFTNESGGSARLPQMGYYQIPVINGSGPGLKLFHKPITSVNPKHLPLIIDVGVISTDPLLDKQLLYKVDENELHFIVMDSIQISGDTLQYRAQIDTLEKGEHLYYSLSFSDLFGQNANLPETGFFDAVIDTNEHHDLQLFHNQVLDIFWNTKINFRVHVLSDTSLTRHMFYYQNSPEAEKNGIEMDSITIYGDTLIYQVALDPDVDFTALSYYFDFQNVLNMSARLPDTGSYFFSTEAIDDDFGQLPKEFTLGFPRPNPFNPSTRIPFFVNNPGVMEVSIFNSAGVRIKKERFFVGNSGKNSYFWNAENLSSGTYFIRFRFNRTTEKVTKLILLK